MALISDIPSSIPPQLRAWPKVVDLLQLRALASAICALSILQIYLAEVGGLAITGYMIACLSGGLFMILKGFVLSRYSLAVLSLIALQLLAMVWSPVPAAALRDAYFGALFIVALTILLTLAVFDPSGLVVVARQYVAVAVFQSILVIIFRILPSIEGYFLGSGIARLFISEKTLVDLTGATVLDLEKSGGLLLAPNVAGVWSLSTATLAFALARAQRWKMGYMIFAVHLFAAAMSGSKATVALVGLLLVVVVFSRLSRSSRMLGLVAMSVIGIVMSDWLIQFQSSELSSASVRALQSRQVMWNFALDEFTSRPLLGLGYGGWSEAFFEAGEAAWEAGASGDLAPHNIFVGLWSATGLFGVFLGLIIIAIGFRYLWLATRCSPGIGGVLLFGYGAYVLQSMGENYAIYAEPHLAGTLALLVAVAYATSSRLSPDSRVVHIMPRLD